MSGFLETLPPFVKLVWHDAHGINESWVHKDEVDAGPCVVVSVGMLLVGLKEGHVSLAQSFNDGDSYDHILCVPEKMVVEMKHIS